MGIRDRMKEMLRPTNGPAQHRASNSISQRSALPSGQVGGPPAVPEVVQKSLIPPVSSAANSQQIENASVFRAAADEQVETLNFTSAITLYEQAIRITPNYPELLLSRALAYRHLNPPRYAAALQDVNAAIQADPTSWSAWHTRGELMVCLNDYDDAEKAFQEAYSLASRVVDRHRVQSSIAELRAKRQLGNSPTQSQPESPASAYQQSANPFAQQGIWTNIPQITPSELPSPFGPVTPQNSIEMPTSGSATVQSFPSSPNQSTMAPSTRSPYTHTSTPINTNSPQASTPQRSTSVNNLPPISKLSLQGAKSATSPNRSFTISSASRSGPTSPQPSASGRTPQPGSTTPNVNNAQATAPASIRPPPSPSLGSRILGAATTTQTPSTTNDPPRQTVQRAHDAGNVNQAPTTTTSLPFSADDVPSEPPPGYTPTANASQPSITAAELNNKMDQLERAIAAKEIGKLSLRPYTSTNQIDAVQLMYVGLTSAQLTAREISTPTYIHPSHANMHVAAKDFPGNTFLDMDPESSLMYDGQLPGTTTISGYSEEYRISQLLAAPALSLQLEANVGLPVVPLAQIIARIQLLKILPVEDDKGLLTFLGLSQVNVLQFGFGVNGTRQKRIDSLCLMLTRAFNDERTRFPDLTKVRTYTGLFLLVTHQPDKTRDFLYQILLGAELLIRLKLQPAGTVYTGIMTDHISSLIVAADLFMQGVQINTSATRSTTILGSAPPLCTFFASHHQRNVESLLHIAEALSWPLMAETRHCLETAYVDLSSGNSKASFDTYDWLFGLVMPGKYYRHRVMCTLVDATPSIRSWNGAPFYDNGIVVKNKSYWPKRTVLGRVLGGLRNPRSVCGWIGPLPAPSGTDANGAPFQGWIFPSARRLEIPTPVVKSSGPLEALGFTNSDTNHQILDAIVDINEYIISPGPSALPNQPKAIFKGIHLEPITQPRLNTAATPTPTSGECRASLDFEINTFPVRYTLFTLPVFVTAPPCVGTHVQFRRQAQMRLRDAVLVKDLKDKYTAPDRLLVINAMGEGDEVVARAWCAERGRHAVIRRDVPGRECCFACACNLAAGDTGLNVNVLIWTK